MPGIRIIYVRTCTAKEIRNMEEQLYVEASR